MNQKKVKQEQKETKCIHRRSFLLRLWNADQPENQNWQASLENPETGVRIGFASLEELFFYLIELTTGDHK